jgi:hypothetical protein
MKLKVVLFIFVCARLICCVTPEAKQAKIYRDNLDTLLGKDFEEVNQMIKDWDFEVLDSWEADNPDAEIIKEHNRPRCGFSKSEIQEIFASKGKYTVMLQMKKISTDTATTGRIGSYGLGVGKDSEHTSENYTLIRTVYRNDKLANYRVWGSVSSSSLSGWRGGRIR